MKLFKVKMNAALIIKAENDEEAVDVIMTEFNENFLPDKIEVGSMVVNVVDEVKDE